MSNWTWTLKKNPANSSKVTARPMVSFQKTLQWKWAEIKLSTLISSVFLFKQYVRLLNQCLPEHGQQDELIVTRDEEGYVLGHKAL
jgi:hypothetical protein